MPRETHNCTSWAGLVAGLRHQLHRLQHQQLLAGCTSVAVFPDWTSDTCTPATSEGTGMGDAQREWPPNPSCSPVPKRREQIT